MNSKDRLSSFSNFGVCVDIHAPGEGIQSSWPSSDTAYAYLGGTSMASPHVAGVKALFLAYNYVKPAELGDALRRLATANVIQGLPANTNNNFIVFNAPPKAKFDAALSGKAGREEEVTEETDLSVARIFDGFGDDDLVDSLDDDVIDSNAVARLQLQTA